MSTAPAWSLPERWDAVLVHRDRAVRVARARLTDPYDVDDCVQEGMARVVAMPNLDLGRVGPLLSTVVANVAADTHRQHVRSTRLSTKLTSSEVPMQPGDEPVCDAAEARWLHSQLGTLGPRERAVLELRAEGRTVAETAAALGMTYKAAESAFTRGRNALKTLWRATLVVLTSAIARRGRIPEYTAGAAALAAGISLAVILPFGSDATAQLPQDTAPGMPPAAYRTAGPHTPRHLGSGSITHQKPSASTGNPSQTIVTIRPPHTYAGPGVVRVTKEHPDESLPDTVQRCIRRGLTVQPDKVRCND